MVRRDGGCGGMLLMDRAVVGFHARQGASGTMGWVCGEVWGCGALPVEKSEKLINTESKVRKAIREGMDPQEAYIKYSVF